jgi:hypothetical protein
MQIYIKNQNAYNEAGENIEEVWTKHNRFPRPECLHVCVCVYAYVCLCTKSSMHIMKEEKTWKNFGLNTIGFQYPSLL